MAEPPVKPDLCELLGIAVNTSALELHATQERALDRIAALGVAAAEVACGADLQGLPLAAVQHDVYFASASMRDLMLDPGTPDARDVLAGELGPILWHIRYGGQHDQVRRAIPLFARWLQHRRLFREIQAPDQLQFLERFSGRTLHEWLSDRCVACGGSGKLERTRSGAWIRPRGAMQRNATFRPCTGCHGNGRARPSATDRLRWLGISRDRYEADGWAQRFNAALGLLQLIAARFKRPLTAQLERRKKRI